MRKRSHSQAKPPSSSNNDQAPGAEVPDEDRPPASDAPPPPEETDVEALPASEDIETLRRKAQERDEFHERFLRAAADFDNRRKRLEREADNRIRYATQGLLTDLLPVFDHLARAAAAAQALPGGEALLEGIRLVEKDLYDALAKHGVHPIQSLGEPFDPQRHEAVSVRPADDVPPNTVLQEVQRGWTLNDRVIRAAKVIVSVPKPAEAAPEAPSNEPPMKGA